MRRTTLGIALLLFIAQLTLIESAKAAPILPAGMYLANSITPSAGGAPTANLCRNGWVITQLLVSKVEPNPYLPGFQFRCSPITITGKVGEATDLHIVVNAGVTQSDYNLFKCPEGEALVGLGVHKKMKIYFLINDYVSANVVCSANF